MRVMGRKNRPACLPACLGFLLLIVEGRQREVDFWRAQRTAARCQAGIWGASLGSTWFLVLLCCEHGADSMQRRQSQRLAFACWPQLLALSCTVQMGKGKPGQSRLPDPSNENAFLTPLPISPHGQLPRGLLPTAQLCQARGTRGEIHGHQSVWLTASISQSERHFKQLCQHSYMADS